MPKEKPLQGGPIRGNDTLKIPEIGYCGNIPATVISRLEREMQGLEFGGVSLIVAFRNGYPAFRIEKIISIIPEQAESDQRGRS